MGFPPILVAIPEWRRMKYSNLFKIYFTPTSKARQSRALNPINWYLEMHVHLTNKKFHFEEAVANTSANQLSSQCFIHVVDLDPCDVGPVQLQAMKLG